MQSFQSNFEYEEVNSSKIQEYAAKVEIKLLKPIYVLEI